jgi:hypothetical protein
VDSLKAKKRTQTKPIYRRRFLTNISFVLFRMADFMTSQKLGSFVFSGMYTSGDEPICEIFYLGGHVCAYIVKYAGGNIDRSFVKSLNVLRRFADFGGDGRRSLLLGLRLLIVRRAEKQRLSIFKRD